MAFNVLKKRNLGRHLFHLLNIASVIKSQNDRPSFMYFMYMSYVYEWRVSNWKEDCV